MKKNLRKSINGVLTEKLYKALKELSCAPSGASLSQCDSHLATSVCVITSVRE